MTMRAVFICNQCSGEFKTEFTGGRTSDFVHDVYIVPATHYKVTDTRGDTYDFCSMLCLATWAKEGC